MQYSAKFKFKYLIEIEIEITKVSLTTVKYCYVNSIQLIKYNSINSIIM